MAFSWFTGSKKKSPEHEEHQPTPDSEYVFVDNTTPTPAVQNPRLPYNIAPAYSTGSSVYPPLQRVSSTDDSIGNNPLCGIELKYSSNITWTEDSDSSAIFADELLKHIKENLSMENFEYNFTLERSILRDAIADETE